MSFSGDAGPSGAGVSGTSPAAAAAISAAISANPYLSSTATRVPGQVGFDSLRMRSLSTFVCIRESRVSCIKHGIFIFRARCQSTTRARTLGEWAPLITTDSGYAFFLTTHARLLVVNFVHSNAFRCGKYTKSS